MKKVTMKTVFWSSTTFFFLINVIGIIIFKDKFRLTQNTLIASVIFACVLFRGVLACLTKDKRLFFLDKRHFTSKFYRYNRPTNKQLNEFYFNATIYFAAIPFYLPIAAFSKSIIQALWCLVLLLAPQFVFVGIEIRQMLLDQKEHKIKEDLQQKEKQEQEKREEMGYWR